MNNNQMVLIGRVPVGLKFGEKNTPLMDIYVNPNNVTHVKPVICPIFRHSGEGKVYLHDEKPEDYICLGTMVFLTTPQTLMSGNTFYGVNPYVYPNSVFTNVKIESVIEILNGNKSYNDLKESDMHDIPDKDLFDRMSKTHI